MVDLTPFKAGIDAAFNSLPVICNDPRGAFLDVLNSYSFTTPRQLIIGKIDRIDAPNERNGKKSGWYIYNEINDTQNDGSIVAFATFGDWRTGIDHNWSSRSEHIMSTSEKEAYKSAREAMRMAKEAEEKKLHTQAAEKAFNLWSNAQIATNAHPYLKAKGVRVYEGLKIDEYDCLIIPMAIKNEIVSLQYIKGDGDFMVNGESIGNKKFLYGGKNKGAWFKIEGENDTIYICEGYSTGASIAEATKNTVYIAFNAGNLYEVATYVKAKHPQSRIIIAGDDDTKNEINIGRNKAEQVANGLEIEAIFPAGFNDFNDMHQEQGIKALREYLKPSKIESYEAPKKELKPSTLKPLGILSDIADYYNMTSGNNQKGFAVQTALACCSLILGRLYKTNYNNFTSLFFLNVGETSTGKEHAKAVFEKILHETNNGMFLAGDGYTSAGAVMSTLLDRPKHGTCTDELGRYLEASMNKMGGSNNQREANTRLMEAFGRCDGVIRPQNYSSMTMKKSDADNIKNRLAHNPAITWLAMTTPSTLFSTIDINAVKDGFINRFIISISDVEPDVRRHKETVAVPSRIKEWAQEVTDRNPSTYIANEPANPVILPFTQDADDAQIYFQRELLEIRKKLKPYSMEGLTGRTNEVAMRIALICALAKNPQAKVVDLESMEWGIDYMRASLTRVIDTLKFTISSSDFEHNKKEILLNLRSLGEEGLTWSQMQKTPPYAQHKIKELREILNSLKDADLIIDETYQPPKGGRPTIKWIALK